MRRWFLLAVLGWSLACSGWLPPPSVRSVSVDDDACGGFVAQIALEHLRGHTVRVLHDGQVVGTWPDLWGDPVVRHEGRGVPGAASELVVEVDGAPPERVPLSLRRPSVTVAPASPSFAPGASPRFELQVDPACPGLRYAATTDTWRGGGPVGGPVQSVVLPPHAEGAHVLRIELAGDGGPAGEVELRFAVGEGDALDADGDGFPAGSDCDDGDPAVNPDAAERPEPNQRDDNCDGRVDEGTVAYDDDGDGLAELQGDCDDADDRIRPGAAERADCRDNDCDRQIDEGRALATVDDPFERPGGVYRVTDRSRRVDLPLDLVSRDRDDVERVEFWSDDGDWDEWGITVTGRRLPADSSYEVQITRVDGTVVGSGTLDRDGDVVSAHGRAFRDDSGNYEVIVTPRRLYAPYCPVELDLVSR